MTPSSEHESSQEVPRKVRELDWTLNPPDMKVQRVGDTAHNLKQLI